MKVCWCGMDDRFWGYMRLRARHDWKYAFDVGPIRVLWGKAR